VGRGTSVTYLLATKLHQISPVPAINPDFCQAFFAVELVVNPRLPYGQEGDIFAVGDRSRGRPNISTVA
jgi:hypothetical protein